MTEPNYTDAQIEDMANELKATENCLPSVNDCTAAADMLRQLLTERQAAMQGQGGEVWLSEARRLHALVAYCPEQRGDKMEVGGDGFMDLLALRNHVEKLLATQSPQPVRSVSEEDVDGALNAAGYDSRHPTFLTEYSVRAALEHFAAIAQEKQS